MLITRVRDISQVRLVHKLKTDLHYYPKRKELIDALHRFKTQLFDPFTTLLDSLLQTQNALPATPTSSPNPQPGMDMELYDINLTDVRLFKAVGLGTKTQEVRLLYQNSKLNALIIRFENGLSSGLKISCNRTADTKLFCHIVQVTKITKPKGYDELFQSQNASWKQCLPLPDVKNTAQAKKMYLQYYSENAVRKALSFAVISFTLLKTEENTKKQQKKNQMNQHVKTEPDQPSMSTSSNVSEEKKEYQLPQNRPTVQSSSVIFPQISQAHEDILSSIIKTDNLFYLQFMNGKMIDDDKINMIMELLPKLSGVLCYNPYFTKLFNCQVRNYKKLRQELEQIHTLILPVHDAFLMHWTLFVVSFDWINARYSVKEYDSIHTFRQHIEILARFQSYLDKLFKDQPQGKLPLLRNSHCLKSAEMQAFNDCGMYTIYWMVLEATGRSHLWNKISSKSMTTYRKNIALDIHLRETVKGLFYTVPLNVEDQPTLQQRSCPIVPENYKWESANSEQPTPNLSQFSDPEDDLQSGCKIESDNDQQDENEGESPDTYEGDEGEMDDFIVETDDELDNGPAFYDEDEFNEMDIQGLDQQEETVIEEQTDSD